MSLQGSNEAPATYASCGRRISSAASLKTGRGSGCRAELRAAVRTTDLSAFKPVQVEKAREAIEQGAVVPLSRPGLYAAVSSDGGLVYLVDAIAQTCTCRAGQNGRRCAPRSRSTAPLRTAVRRPLARPPVIHH